MVGMTGFHVSSEGTCKAPVVTKSNHEARGKCVSYTTDETVQEMTHFLYIPKGKQLAGEMETSYCLAFKA